MELIMKLKRLLFPLMMLIICSTKFFADINNSVDISDTVYDFLQTAELQGLCSSLSNVKPYSEKYILEKLDEIELNVQESNNKFAEKQLLIIEDFRKRSDRKEGLKLQTLNYRQEGEKAKVPVSIDIDLANDLLVSGGIYSDNINSFGYEFYQNLNITGNIGKNVSYSAHGYAGVTSMPMTELGNYDVGYWWYDCKNDGDYPTENVRTIKTYRNYSVLPYSYKKFWDGSVYYLNGGVNAGGLTGWAFEDALAFGMQGEIRASFNDNLVQFTAGRINREWAAMDKGSSLVLNSNAHPFFGLEAEVSLFKWISFSTLTGFLEFPNQKYMTSNAWYITDDEGDKLRSVNDSYFSHNLYAIGMLDIDFKYFHWDFGSTVVLPNRFELGYSFPLLNQVIYQNNVGDYDNLALFTDVKFKYSGIGYVWGSLFLDEMNSLTAKLFEATRCMFAYQAGTKVSIPWLPFASVSFRYTKVEPYCYTHQALKSEFSQPYYANYISESYTNNGECIGYYLDPNSDEFLLKIETQTLPSAQFGFQYQLIRHGVDWGSLSSMYSGSSLYSELPTGSKRGELRKYFLRDGTYEWMNICSLYGSYDLKRHGFPIQIYGTIGYVANWFTTIGDANPSKTTDYYVFESDEYNSLNGLVITVGVKAFY